VAKVTDEITILIVQGDVLKIYCLEELKELT